jgi:CheY-like chemotaxis protein
VRRSINLLLIDDDEVDRELVRRFLPEHYRVCEAALGFEALTLTTTFRPDCILLDWQLPDIDGLHLLQCFHKANIPVIVITGHCNPQVIVEVMQHGAQDFLLKDELSRSRLEQTLLTALESRIVPVKLGCTAVFDGVPSRQRNADRYPPPLVNDAQGVY